MGRDRSSLDPRGAEALPSPFFAWILAAAAGLALLYALRLFYHDDAYIALSYARNLHRGRGLVWKTGEHVEGYTSLLWVVACAALGWLGLDLEVATRVLGLASLGALIATLVWRQGRCGAWAVALLATGGPAIAWSIGGLETVAFALFVTAALLAGERLLDEAWGAEESAPPQATATRHAVGVGLLFGLAEWCRPEAPLFFGLTASLLALRWLRARARGDLVRLVCLVAGFAALYLPRLAWRWSYYHDLLPNTAYVKVPGGTLDVLHGVGYVGTFALYYLLPLLPAVVVSFFAGTWRSIPRGGYLACCVAAYLAYVVVIGGDHMQWFRFIVPVLPVGLLLTARWVEAVSGGRRWIAASTLGALVAVNLFSTRYLSISKPWWLLDPTARSVYWWFPDPAARSGAAVGIWIKEHWPAGSLVALNTAGSTAYFSDLPCIDMLGLNDRHISRRSMPPPPKGLSWALLPGHRKGDGAYVLSRHPDFIILGGATGQEWVWFVGDQEISETAEFKAGYRRRDVRVPAFRGFGPYDFRYYERTIPGGPGAP